MALVLSLGAVACPGDGPISVLVPYAAGGSLDVTTRLVAKAVSIRLGRSIVVMNAAGASGLIAVRRLLAAPLDGCTLLGATVNTVVILPAQNPHAGFSSTDLTPIALVGETEMVLVASVQSGLRDMAALKQAARSARALRAGHPGADSVQALALDALESRLQAHFVQVPYSGAGMMVGDLAGGHIELAVLAKPVAMPLVKRGMAVLLGTMRLNENDPLPTWSGWFAARGVASAAVMPVRQAMLQSLADPPLARALTEMGMDLDRVPAEALVDEVARSAHRVRHLLAARHLPTGRSDAR
jgi:tripartite-type tricarboxylate transporter receptor subunit TctC